MIEKVFLFGSACLERLFLHLKKTFIRAQEKCFRLFLDSKGFKFFLLLCLLGYFVYTTVVGLYFEQFGNRYTFSNILLDYNFGIIRRGLTGEIASWFFTPPIEYKDYLIFYHIRFAAIMVLFLGLFYRLIKKGMPFLLILLPLITYPTLLRFVWSDFGRTEPWGTIACLLLFFIPHKTFARVFILAVIPVLMLFHINQLVTYVSSILLIYWILWGEKKDLKSIVYFLFYTGISFLVVSYASSPDVDLQTLFEYISSKTSDVTYKPKNFKGPYTGVVSEIIKSFYKPQYWVMVFSVHWNLLIMPLSIYFMYRCFEKSGLLRIGSLFGKYSILILVPYGVVFLLTDYGRFFATYTTCMYLVLMAMYFKHSRDETVLPLEQKPEAFWLIVFVCLMGCKLLVMPDLFYN